MVGVLEKTLRVASELVAVAERPLSVGANDQQVFLRVPDVHEALEVARMVGIRRVPDEQGFYSGYVLGVWVVVWHGSTGR
jgi:hypothetical protein